MRGTDETSGSLFSYVDIEGRIPARHPLRRIRQVVNDALSRLDADFEALYVGFGRPSIAPEQLIRASLIQILFSVRSERQLMEQLHYNLMFRWFVGPGIDDPVWVPMVFRAPRFFQVFSAVPRRDRFEVGRRPLTGGLVGGFVSVTWPFALDPRRFAS